MLARRLYLCLITFVFSIFINLSFLLSADTINADPLIISGSTQMTGGGSQTLTASGGTGPYTWSVATGGGSINPSTGSYTAPASNPDCALNPTICVQDATGQMACKQIAVNIYTNYNYQAYSVYIAHCQTSSGYWGCYYNCQGYGCDGVARGYFCTPSGYGYDPGCGGECYPYGAVCSEGILDTRSVFMKTGGCCPAGLTGGGPETNNKGKNPCQDIPSESSANFKSGNLYHDQRVGKLTLSYNSIDTYEGPVGKKWTHNYNIRLTALSDNATLVLNTEDGNIIYFHLNSGIYYPDAVSGDTSTIVKNVDNTYTRTLKNGTIQTFNTAGLLTSITDRNSNITTLTYNSSDLTSIIDQNNRTTAITTTDGKITAITDALGRTHTITYTDSIITAITDPLSNAWQFTYDTTGKMLTKTDPLNNVITYTYDTNGKLLTSTDPENKTRTMNYNQMGTTTYTEKNGGIWTYTYDSTYTVKTAQTDPLGNTTTYKYDLKRNLTEVKYPDNSTITYTHDNNGNMLTQTDQSGKTTTYIYNSLNLVTSITDPRNNTTNHAYDALGNLTSVTDPLNNTTTYQYDSRGNITSITNPLNKTTTITYDSNNNLLTVTDPKNGTVTMTYDAMGNMLTQTDPLNKTTTFIYNNLNQLTQVTDPMGYITQYTYDYKGNRLSTTDANTKPTWYTYDYKGQIKTITDALNNQTIMTYGTTGCSSCSGVDKLTAITDAKNQTTSYEYDMRGKLIKETDPLNKITSYTYDNKGNLITRTSPDNKTITYAYDLNNRLTQKTYSDNTITQFQYDNAGNMTYAGNQNIAYNFTYDANNRITNITDSNNRTIQYTYDAAGNRLTMITPENKTITYNYDNNQLSQITTDLGNFTFNYDAANRRTTRNLPNGTISTYAYDDSSRLTGIATTNGGTTIDSINYTLDGVGNRLTKAQPQQSITVAYTYDDIYRLTQANPTGGSYLPEAYTYDQVGNRLTGVNEQIPTNNETTTYTYDDEDRLTGVQINSNNLTRELTFTYDPFGRRIKKTVSPSGGGSGEEITNYVYDNQNIILEYNTNNEIQTRYTHGPNIDEPLVIEIKGTTTFTPYYYHADGLGSITALTDTNGSIVQRYEYDSFGNQTITTNGNISQPFTYTAREYDTETGMYFYRARYYDSKVGRFVTKDPILHPSNGNSKSCGGSNFVYQSNMPSFAELQKNPQNLNPYAYTRNNPISYDDPLGLACGSGWEQIFVPNNWFGWYSFEGPCSTHDDCYGCAGKKMGKSQTACDAEFYRNMLSVCNSLPQGAYWRNHCEGTASIYYSYVRKNGQPYFEKARKECCDK